MLILHIDMHAAYMKYKTKQVEIERIWSHGYLQFMEESKGGKVGFTFA